MPETPNLKIEREVKISAQDHNLPALADFLFKHVPKEDLQKYHKSQLLLAAQSAVTALLKHERGKSTIFFDPHIIEKEEEELTVLTIVNENKPFLFASLMNIIAEFSLSLSFVAHPIFSFEKLNNKPEYRIEDIKGREVEEGNGNMRISLIQFHIKNLSEELKGKLYEKICDILQAIDVCVQDWKPMVEQVQLLAQNYKKIQKQPCQEFIDRVPEFLHWLCDENFIFLGLRHYENDQKGTKIARVNLGLLRDKDLLSASFVDLEDTEQDICSLIEQEKYFLVTKSDVRSPVHRDVWMDYIQIKSFDASGIANGQIIVLGLFTSTSYTSSIFRIPYLRRKAETVIHTLGFDKKDYSGKVLTNVLETYPRDEMFHINVEELIAHAELLLELTEMPRVRVLTHMDPLERFVSVLVYLPNECYNINNAKKVAQYLLEAFDGDFFEKRAPFVQGSLTRLSFVIHRRVSSKKDQHLDRLHMEKHIVRLTRSWGDHIENLAYKQKIDSPICTIAKNFSDAYRENFTFQEALQDAKNVFSLTENRPLIVHFYPPENGETGQDKGQEILYLKLFHLHKTLALSDRVPLLENLGFHVIDEQTYELFDHKMRKVYMHDMQLEYAGAEHFSPGELSQQLSESFEAIWSNKVDNDAFNGLILSSGLRWREVIIVRAYGRYLQQVGAPYSQDRLAQALNNHPHIVHRLYALFKLRFNPESRELDCQESEENIQDSIERALQNVQNLDDDIILRRFRNLIQASLRTNAYTPLDDGSLPTLIAIKFCPKLIEGLVEPHPLYEIFVYSAQVEGVHLRFGSIARGGIRWSDRALDYRTEILGLVKAQQVKNVVIVPVGAKGGFYPRQLPQTNDRSIIQEAARQAYILYISALLSITDNIIEEETVHPKNVACHDGCDPYLVVAADKGTASFSDTANEISQRNDFWLDDAFASGGSAGYDHKLMAITAKGAWVAVKRHFRELLQRNIEEECFTLVGVGDMSGDVFGNGLLLSKYARLIAAFDHRDIFIDPDPDPAISYAERLRLFNLPRSSWQDYDKSKLSKGGGIYSRGQKTITLSKEAAAALNLGKETATPFEVIRAILKAKVDLLWFGGIGTYVRSQTETDAMVGDHANDAVRITGQEVGAKIIGEGANLGMTQAGRIEYSLAGGRCDTDAIDNSAGVNCSDVEVNLKIAFAAAMRQNLLTREKRDKILKEMTPDVERLVLRNNYLQTLALSLAEERGAKDIPVQSRFMYALERKNQLDRKLELLPTDQALKERFAKAEGLTRPELAVLLAYAKLTMQQQVSESKLVEDPYFQQTLIDYFPLLMQKEFSEQIIHHPLRRDIIATSLVNDIVNSGGPIFVSRLIEKTGRSLLDIFSAYVEVRDSFSIVQLFEEIHALDNILNAKIQNSFYEKIRKMLLETTRRVLRTSDLSTDLETRIVHLKKTCTIVQEGLESFVPASLLKNYQEELEYYRQFSIKEGLAQNLAFLTVCPHVPQIAKTAHQLQTDPARIAKIYFALEGILHVETMVHASENIAIIDYYDMLALAEANDKILKAIERLLVNIHETYKEHEDPVSAWQKDGGTKLETARNRISALLEQDLNIARFTVAASMLKKLALTNFGAK